MSALLASAGISRWVRVLKPTPVVPCAASNCSAPLRQTSSLIDHKFKRASEDAGATKNGFSGALEPGGRCSGRSVLRPYGHRPGLSRLWLSLWVALLAATKRSETTNLPFDGIVAEVSVLLPPAA